MYCISHEVLINSLKPSNKRNINTLKLCCKVLDTSQSIGNSSPPEDSEDFFQPTCVASMPLSAPEHLAKALGRMQPVATSLFRPRCTSCHVDICGPGLIFEVNTVEIDYLKKFILDQSNNITISLMLKLKHLS